LGPYINVLPYHFSMHTTENKKPEEILILMNYRGKKGRTQCEIFINYGLHVFRSGSFFHFIGFICSFSCLLGGERRH
jgi:hypothetical protein